VPHRFGGGEAPNKEASFTGGGGQFSEKLNVLNISSILENVLYSSAPVHEKES
jgi:hypothetical protein